LCAGSALAFTVAMRRLLLVFLVSCGRTEVVFPSEAEVRSDAGQRDAAVLDAGRRDGGVVTPVDAGFDGGIVDPGPWAPKPCLPGRHPLERTVPIVVLVVDGSGSMAEPFDLTTKAKTLQSVAMLELPSWDPWMEIGLLPFGADDCSIAPYPSLAPRRGQVGTFRGFFGLAQGRSPTSDALETAVTTLARRRASNASEHIVLVSDGFPNCNATLSAASCRCLGNPCLPIDCLDDQRTIGTVRRASTTGIQTWVVGFDTPDAGVRGVLDGLAVAGRRSRLFPDGALYAHATDDRSVALHLRDLRDRIRACTFFSRSVPSTGSLSVLADGQPVPENEDGGWAWVDRLNGTIGLFGAACERQLVATPPALSVDVRCP